MAERVSTVRLKIVGGKEVRAELKGVGDDGDKALKRVAEASVPASRGLMALDAASAGVRAKIEDVAAGGGVAAAALTRLGPAGLLAGASIGAMVATLTVGIREFAQAEQASLKLEAVLKATGYAAGLTGAEIGDLADTLEASTMASAESIKNAAGIMATFRSVSGDTFKRAVTLAQDMAAVFGGDVTSAATQLGKALEDPVEGLTALRRVGVTFTETQKTLIQSLVDTGQTAEAQKVILDALAQQVGGAGTAEAGGLTGAFKAAADATGNMLERWATLTGVAPAVAAALRGVAAAANAAATAGLDDGKDAARLKKLEGDLSSWQDRLSKAKTVPYDFASGAAAEQAERRVKDIQEEIDWIKARTSAREKEQKAERDKVESGRAVAEYERNATRQVELNKAIEKSLAGVATNEEKVAAIRKSAAADIAKQESLRGKSGVDEAAIDASIAKIRTLEQRQIEAVNKAVNTASAKASDRTRDLIDDLVAAAETVDDKRAAFIRSYEKRLGDEASPEEVAKVRELAGAVYDLRRAQALSADAEPLKAYNREMEELNRLLAEGKISQEAYAVAAGRVKEQLAGNQIDALIAQGDALSGLKAGLMDYANEAGNAAKQAASAIGSIFGSVEDAIVQGAMAGKLQFADLAKSIEADLIRLTVRSAVTGPLARMLTSGLGSLFSSGGGAAPIDFTGIFHSGGMVGAGGGMKAMPARFWEGAPRMHSGGPVGGLRHDERPIIAQIGERIQSREEVLRGGQPGIVFNVSNNAPATEVSEPRVMRGPDGRTQIAMEVNRIIATGAADKAAQGRWGVRAKPQVR